MSNKCAGVIYIERAYLYFTSFYVCKSYLQINDSSFRVCVILWFLVFFVKVYIIVPHIYKFHANWVDFLVYLRVYLNKLLRAQVITWHIFKGKDVQDYYYIEIVKCYLCLALNHHQNGVSTRPCESFEGLWCLQMWRKIMDLQFKWFAQFLKVFIIIG